MERNGKNVAENCAYCREAKLFGGKLKSTFIQEMEKEKIACCDLMREDGIVIYNAKLTAESIAITLSLVIDFLFCFSINISPFYFFLQARVLPEIFLNILP